VLIRFGQILACVALFSIAGGHYAVLQTVAWTGMLIDYSRSAGLVEGVKQTFDGEHPCKMCMSIEESKKEEEQQQTPLTTIKPLDLKALALALPPGPDQRASSDLSHPRQPTSLPPSLTQSPPTPPPKFATA
jgi:hypothetical protein